MGMQTRRVAITAAAVAMLVADAPAAGRVVYRDPPSYQGVRTAPKTAAAPAPQAPPPFVLSGAGSFPDMLVDEAGTGHVVWNEDRGDGADVVVYCRIPRGASACNARTELRSEIPDSSPDARYDSGGPPKIARLGDQLVVLSKRYPVVRNKPDGASSHTVLAWSSSDGGTAWTAAPKIVGKRNIDELVVIGSDEDPTIFTIGVDPFCEAPGPAGLCTQAIRSGEYAAANGNLSTGRDQNYEANLTRDAQGRPVLSVQDLAFDTFVRRWTGAGSPLDSSTWTTSPAIPFDQSSIAGGPAGVFLMGKPKSGSGAYAVSRLDDSQTAGAGRTISAESGNVLGELFQGPDGRLFAAWEQRGRGLLLRSTSGPAGAQATFGRARRIVDGDNNGQISVDATADGGGFAAYNHTAGVVGEGEVQVAGFGRQVATGKPGIADLAGGGIVPGGSGTGGSCSELSFGAFTAEAVGGCILKGTGARSQEYVTGGEINLWGLRIIPEAGVKIIIDPKRLQLDTTGTVRVLVTAPAPVGDVLLFKGELHRDLSKVVPGTNLFEFSTGDAVKGILGFDIAGGINVRLERDGVHIPLNLKLPPAFGGFQASAEFVATKDEGLRIDSVRLEAGPIPLGALLINKIELEYKGGDDLWTGFGSITVPAGGTLDLGAQFAMGAFKSATFSFTPGTPVPIGPFVYLLQFGGGFFLDPVTINANATIGAGAAVAGRSPVEVRGDFTMTFPEVGPADFRLKGTVGLFMFRIGEGELNFQSDGYAAFRGRTGVSLGPLSVDANLDGFIDAPTGQYGASLDGKVELCLVVDVELDEIRVCAGASAAAAVSSKGFAACARFKPPIIDAFEAGLTYPWEDWNPAFLANPLAFSASILSNIGGCHVEEYRITPTRARASQAGAATTFEVPPGLPSQTVLLTGNGGRPDVTVTGPGGQKGTVFYAEGTQATYAILDRPAAGTWTVTPRAGSPAVAQVLTANGYRPARVAGNLGGKGRKRTLRYRVRNGGNGQQVVFQESGAFGSHRLGAAKGASGTLRFRPADAKGGKRTVVALVQRRGITTDRIRIGTYVAPGPSKPGRARGVKVRRAGRSVVVSFRSAPGAARHAVTLKGARGTRLGELLGKGKRRVRFPAVHRNEKVTVTVRGLSSKLRLGPAVRRGLRAQRRG